MRGTKERSQTFKWFAASLWLYVTDRLYAYTCRTFTLECDLDASIATENPTSASKKHGHLPSRCILLRIPRPVQFTFSPGQWAYLQIPDIDVFWHPFSIGSDPGSAQLEFMVEVKGPGSWSEKLWMMVTPPLDEKGLPCVFQKRRIFTVQVQGPFGSALMSSSTAYTKVLAVGAGSGIVPMLSMLRRNTAQLCQLDRSGFYKANRLQKDNGNKLVVEYSARREVWVVALQGLVTLLRYTFLPKLFMLDKQIDKTVNGFISRRRSSASIVNTHTAGLASEQEETIRPAVAPVCTRAGTGGVISPRVNPHVTGHATFSVPEKVAGRAIQLWLMNRILTRAVERHQSSALLRRVQKDFRDTLLGFVTKVCYVGLPCWGVVCLACMWSFQTHVLLGTDLREWMIDFLKISSFIGVSGFGVFALNQKAASLMVAVDVSVAACAIAACVLWTRAGQWGHFDDPAMAAYMLFGFYMLLRYWAGAVSEKGTGLVESAVELTSGSIFVPECFDLVWTTRSAIQVATLLPALNKQCEMMHLHWGGGDAATFKARTHEQARVDRVLAQMVQKVNIYVTDPDAAAVTALKRSAEAYSFVKIHYQRPNLAQWIQKHSQQLVVGDSFIGARMTVTMLAFCGSSKLGAHVDALRQATLWNLELLGARSHHITFEQENFGHNSSPAAPAPPAASPVVGGT